jgi:heme-degrading monooxygenase HmoA
MLSSPHLSGALGLAGRAAPARRREPAPQTLSGFGSVLHDGHRWSGGPALSDTYTCSVWTVPEGRHDEFVAAFQRFAAAADEIGAREGFILQDEDEPARFIVVRRWESAEAVQRWQQDDQRRDEPGAALRRLAPQAQQAYLTRRVAEL